MSRVGPPAIFQLLQSPARRQRGDSATKRWVERPPPQSGSTLELLRIYAVVHTVLRNVEEANRVVLLWNGVQRPSLAGHVDTGHPLRLRVDLEAS